ncbi:MAG: hypothetical protein D6812_08160 [Deltaproteobacteria bacterium]|nr:MAG: hypothetical protein D6812_08160 [Deltaproteobacteria bacterium]
MFPTRFTPHLLFTTELLLEARKEGVQRLDQNERIMGCARNEQRALRSSCGFFRLVGSAPFQVVSKGLPISRFLRYLSRLHP